MPQFDFYVWSSLGFWTVFFFQVSYFFILYYIITSISEYQKTVKKVDVYVNRKKEKVILLDYFAGLYYKSLKKSSKKL